LRARLISTLPVATSDMRTDERPFMPAGVSGGVGGGGWGWGAGCQHWCSSWKGVGCSVGQGAAAPRRGAAQDLACRVLSPSGAGGGGPPVDSQKTFWQVGLPLTVLQTRSCWMPAQTRVSSPWGPQRSPAHAGDAPPDGRGQRGARTLGEAVRVVWVHVQDGVREVFGGGGRGAVAGAALHRLQRQRQGQGDCPGALHREGTTSGTSFPSAVPMGGSSRAAQLPRSPIAASPRREA
jgi:hypothetical protein